MARSGLITALSPATTASRADTDSNDGRRRNRRSNTRSRTN